MRASPRLRIRFHAVSPDGRQTMPVAVDVLLFTRVASVSTDGLNEADWLFNSGVAYDGAVEHSLAIGGMVPLGCGKTGPRTMRALYPGIVHVGDHWSIAHRLVHVTSSPTIIAPQSGVVVHT
jgi:hypothetical protein